MRRKSDSVADGATTGKDMRNKRTRFLIAGVIGTAIGLAGGVLLRWGLAPLIGWDGAAIILLYLLWKDFHPHDGTETERIAQEEDIEYSTIDFLVLVACLISIGAVALMLTSRKPGFETIGFGLFSIVLSWTTVHALYMLRYAELYYRDVNGGIIFEGTEKPNFWDFAYLAFTIGMTYQVSDMTFTTPEFRKAALGHALLSFVFGTAIIATTINFVASLSG
jgi:uncharacterized membrane protein